MFATDGPIKIQSNGCNGSNHTVINRFAGNVGIGSASPQAKLHVEISNDADDDKLFSLVHKSSGGGVHNQWNYGINTSGSLILNSLKPNSVSVINPSGRVGIGTYTVPVEADLAVGGNVYIEIENDADDDKLLSLVHKSSGGGVHNQWNFGINTSGSLILNSLKPNSVSIINPDGKVGIGTNNVPLGYGMSVGGNMYVDNGNIKIEKSSNSVDDMISFVHKSSGGDIHSQWKIRQHTTGSLEITDPTKTEVLALNAGKVGINAPNYNDAEGNRVLFVGGGIICEELEVQLSDQWADYVFDKNYELKSLEEVEAYVNENHHLPDVPSALEVKENGIAVSEMLKVQMQKIEELTLYVIELEKQLNELKSK